MQEAFPSLFTLWLKGLGNDHIATRHHRAADNAEVERWHRTLNEYVVIWDQHHSGDQLQRTLEQALKELLNEQPFWAKASAGRPPAVAYPQMFASSRPLQPDNELAHFDPVRVDAFRANLS